MDHWRFSLSWALETCYCHWDRALSSDLLEELGETCGSDPKCDVEVVSACQRQFVRSWRLLQVLPDAKRPRIPVEFLCWSESRHILNHFDTYLCMPPGYVLLYRWWQGWTADRWKCRAPKRLGTGMGFPTTPCRPRRGPLALGRFEAPKVYPMIILWSYDMWTITIDLDFMMYEIDVDCSRWYNPCGSLWHCYAKIAHNGPFVSIYIIYIEREMVKWH